MAIFMAPVLMFVGLLDLQAATLRGFAPRKPAQVIPFPTRRRRFRSGNRQLSRDVINAAIDGVTV